MLLFISKLFSNKKKVNGFIKYYGLEDLWLNQLNEEQREEVKVEYETGVVTMDNTEIVRDAVDKDNIHETTGTKTDFLLTMAKGISDYQLKLYLIDLAHTNIDKTNIIDQHFAYMRTWKILKQMIKDEKSLYQKYIKVLEDDCAIYDEFNQKYFEQWGETVSYPSFKELALAYERTDEIQKAIEISKLAIEKDVKENTSFENRIKRLEKKL